MRVDVEWFAIGFVLGSLVTIGIGLLSGVFR